MFALKCKYPNEWQAGKNSIKSKRHFKRIRQEESKLVANSFSLIFNTCWNHLYNKALRSYICIYMLAISGQTAEPNWLTFFKGTQGFSGETRGKYLEFFF